MIRIMVVGLRGIGGVQGGIESHVENIYLRIARRENWRIEVVSRHAYHRELREAPQNLLVAPLWSPQRTGLEAFFHTFLAVLYAGIKRPEVLHIHAVGPGLFVPLARVLLLKVLFTHHGFDYEREKWGGFARRLLQLGEWLAVKCSHSTIAVSDQVASRLRRRYQTTVKLIKNGATFSSADHRADVLEEFGLRKRAYVISVARIVPEKRQLDIIDAYTDIENPDYDLLIVGGDGGNKQYSNVVNSRAEKHVGIKLTGAVSGDRLNQLLENAGCFVLASSHEGFSIAALEAVNAQIPLLLSDIPANLELGLSEECYFPLADVRLLRKKIVSTMSTRPDDKALRERRIAFAKDYSWDSIAQQTQRAISELIT